MQRLTDQVSLSQPNSTGKFFQILLTSKYVWGGQQCCLIKTPLIEEETKSTETDLLLPIQLLEKKSNYQMLEFFQKWGKSVI